MQENAGALLAQIRDLAFGRANDAVKLIFLEPEQMELVDGLDLRMVSEIKRAANGAVEVKLINRLALLELLSGMLDTGEGRQGQAESFFRAMEAAAEKLGDGGRAV